jgi:NodT family efflux transporter outer membrane factor (OMF) lipoprotein
MNARVTSLPIALLAVAALAAHAEPSSMTGIAPAAPAGWRHEAGSAAVQEDWWQGFGDATLARLIHEALARNQDLRQAAARVAEARALATAQHAAFWPTVEAGVGAGRSRSVDSVTLGLFQASYEVDLFGRVDAVARAADRSEEANRAARDSLALTVAASVAQAYIGLLELDAQLDLVRRLVASRERTVVLMRGRREQGYVGSLELAQAEVEWHASAQALPQLARALDRQEAQLNLLLGRPPGAVERGGELVALSPCALPEAGLPSELLRRRPDVYAAELQVAASDAQLAAARAQMMPALRLGADFGRLGASVLRNGPFTIWAVGGSVLAPIFNGGRLRALSRASEARRDQAVAAYERAVLGAWAEVEVQLGAVEQQQIQLREALAQRDAVAEALRIAVNRHRAGYASALDERLAERTLYAADQGVVSQQSGLLQSQVALFRALGGGWSAVSP